MCLKKYIWNPSTYTCENGKYLGSIIGDFVILCCQMMEVTKAYPTKIPNNNYCSKSYFKKNLFQQILKKKGNLYNGKFIYFTHLCISYYITIDNC